MLIKGTSSFNSSRVRSRAGQHQQPVHSQTFASLARHSKGRHNIHSFDFNKFQSVFTRKFYFKSLACLVPLRIILPTMIDWHSHILPGIDDGPAEIGQSLAMASALSVAGFTTVYCTPHLIRGCYEAGNDEVRLGVAELRSGWTAAASR